MMRTLSSLLALAMLAACSVAAAVEERFVRKEAVIDAPVAKVWAAWTTNDGIASFFAPEAVVEPKPDGLFSIHMNPGAKPGMKGADGMRVLGVQPERMLSFTWNAPPHLPEARAQRTVVIVRLEPVSDSRTAVQITQVGWGNGGEWDEAFKYFDRAWGNVLVNLQKRFVENKPIDWAPFLARLKAAEEQAKK